MACSSSLRSARLKNDPVAAIASATRTDRSCCPPRSRRRGEEADWRHEGKRACPACVRAMHSNTQTRGLRIVCSREEGGRFRGHQRIKGEGACTEKVCRIDTCGRMKGKCRVEGAGRRPFRRWEWGCGREVREDER